jgi:hypothetical protein
MNYKFNLGFNSRNYGSSNFNPPIDIGSTRGAGSITRRFNWCKQHSPNPSLCIYQFINVIPSTPPSPPPPPPPPTTNAAWARYRGNSNDCTGKSNFTGPLNGNNIQQSTNQDILRGSTPVIDENGNIYICGSNNTDYLGKLYCFNPDLSTKWIFDPSGADSGTAYVVPAIGSDGTIFFTSTMDNITEISSLFAINPDGTLKWRVDNLIGSTNNISLILDNNENCCFGTGAGWIYVVNSTGTIISSRYYDGYNFNGWNCSLDYITQHLFIGTGNKIVCYSIENNNTVWETDFGSYVGNSNPAIYNDHIFVPTASGYLLKINKSTGTIVASSEQYSNMDGCSALIDGNGNVYIGGSSNLIKFNANTMATIWVYSDSGYFTSPLMDNNNNIYVFNQITKVFTCIDQNNNIIWTKDISEYITGFQNYSSPGINKTNVIYLGTYLGLISFSDS